MPFASRNCPSPVPVFPQDVTSLYFVAGTAWFAALATAAPTARTVSAASRKRPPCGIAAGAHFGTAGPQENRFLLWTDGFVPLLQVPEVPLPPPVRPPPAMHVQPFGTTLNFVRASPLNGVLTSFFAHIVANEHLTRVTLTVHFVPDWLGGSFMGSTYDQVGPVKVPQPAWLRADDPGAAVATLSAATAAIAAVVTAIRVLIAFLPWLKIGFESP